ncbi:MAG: PAS-domain containing protein [Candidatus Saccharibacteria bacterium]|nr:PAS-domain containing protein [Pseudorhodobacter sp.]
MIDPTDPLPVQVVKQAKIIKALIDRADRAHQVGRSAYTLFQSAIALQSAIWEKTKDLEKALDTLGRTSSELQITQLARDRMQISLADTIGAMEGGFALFTEERLQVCNTQFRQLLPDVAPKIQPGLTFHDYLAAVGASRYIRQPVKEGPQTKARTPDARDPSRFVMALKNDRWFQISYRQTSSENIVVLQTEITDIVHENRLEKDRLIDRHAQFLQAAFDHMSLGICTFSADGELLVRNERFGELLGVPLSLLKKGSQFRRIVEHVERTAVLDIATRKPDVAAWSKALLRGGSVQAQFRRDDGLCLDLRIHPLPDEGFIVSLQDITAETLAAVARERLNETLELRVQKRTAELTEANRLLQMQSVEQARTEDALRLAKEAAETAHVAKTQFLAAASHDLLQPISAAKLYISTLKEHPSQSADTVDRLDRSFASMESLLHALLDISRLDSPGAEFNITAFCLEGLLRTVAEDMAPLAAEKGLALRIVPSTHWVTSDHRYLLRCVHNLAANAIQYTHSGRVLIGCRLTGSRLRIEVWDTGIGISEQDQTRIFNEFTRLGGANAGSGMGLGLSIVERACRHLSHPMRVVSQPGHGSMFSIDVPLAAHAYPSRTVLQPFEPVQTGSLDLIVMLVENDADVLHAMTLMLEGWGASVIAATSTAEALAQMRQIGTPPDILLVDYRLDGDDNGVDTIRSLRALAAAPIPAIMVTANRSKALLRTGGEMAFSVLTKPVQPARLRALINWKTRQSAKPGKQVPDESTDKGRR